MFVSLCEAAYLRVILSHDRGRRSVIILSSEIIHDGLVSDFLRDVSSFNVFQSSEGLSLAVITGSWKYLDLARLIWLLT